MSVIQVVQEMCLFQQSALLENRQIRESDDKSAYKARLADYFSGVRGEVLTGLLSIGKEYIMTLKIDESPSIDGAGLVDFAAMLRRHFEEEVAGGYLSKGARIKYFREGLGMSATELAIISDISCPQISHYETGHRPITKSAAYKLGQGLGMPDGALLLAPQVTAP